MTYAGLWEHCWKPLCLRNPIQKQRGGSGPALGIIYLGETIKCWLWATKLWVRAWPIAHWIATRFGQGVAQGWIETFSCEWHCAVFFTTEMINYIVF